MSFCLKLVASPRPHRQQTKTGTIQLFKNGQVKKQRYVHPKYFLIHVCLGRRGTEHSCCRRKLTFELVGKLLTKLNKVYFSNKRLAAITRLDKQRNNHGVAEWVTELLVDIKLYIVFGTSSITSSS